MTSETEHLIAELRYAGGLFTRAAKALEALSLERDELWNLLNIANAQIEALQRPKTQTFTTTGTGDNQPHAQGAERDRLRAQGEQ